MKECELYKIEDNKLICLSCAHKCRIAQGKTGICGVRKNLKNKLYLLVYEKIVSMSKDPIEKKPLYHFLKGSYAFSIGTYGCNFACDFCQNFEISQQSKEIELKEYGEKITSKEIVEEAIKTRCESIAYTYNEPSIYLEFVKEISILARKNKLKNILVTNGYFSKESFEYIKDYIDAMNIDLKSFNEKFYKNFCKAKLQPVLDTIKKSYENNIHIEITTLLIPGLNDSQKEIEEIAKFIASVNKDIPWHITRFFPRYKMLNKDITPLDSLELAYKIGKKYLKNVHIGNV